MQTRIPSGELHLVRMSPVCAELVAAREIIANDNDEIEQFTNVDSDAIEVKYEFDSIETDMVMQRCKMEENRLKLILRII